MTKREILKWLEEKERSTRQNLRTEYLQAYKTLEDEAVAELGVSALADQIEAHFDEIHRLWTTLKERNCETPGLEFSRYICIENMFSTYRASKGDTLKKLLYEDVFIKTAEMERLDANLTVTLNKIRENYRNVMAVVESMRKAKDAAAYLAKLGFDLTELNSAEKQEVTALTVKIDTSYLFLQQKAA